MKARLNIKKRRRREGKTDYLARKKMLSGNLPRIVVRRSNKYMTVNYITSKNAQDKVEISVNSKKLLKYGWPKEWIGSLRSTPACYLLGYVAGKEIVSKYKEKVILDLGLMRTIPKSRVYAILKGLVDAGVKINCNKKVFPSEERIKGQHMKKDVEEILNKVKLAIGGKDE